MLKIFKLQKCLEISLTESLRTAMILICSSDNIPNTKTKYFLKYETLPNQTDRFCGAILLLNY